MTPKSDRGIASIPVAPFPETKGPVAKDTYLIFNPVVPEHVQFQTPKIKAVQLDIGFIQGIQNGRLMTCEATVRVYRVGKQTSVNLGDPKDIYKLVQVGPYTESENSVEGAGEFLPLSSKYKFGQKFEYVYESYTKDANKKQLRLVCERRSHEREKNPLMLSEVNAVFNGRPLVVTEQRPSVELPMVDGSALGVEITQ
jgi:hypothetical protein